MDRRGDLGVELDALINEATDLKKIFFVDYTQSLIAGFFCPDRGIQSLVIYLEIVI